MGVDWRLLNRYKSGEMSEERVELLYNQISDVSERFSFISFPLKSIHSL